MTPYSRRRSVSTGDCARALPGDDLVPDAQVVFDRELSFDATPDQVWPWLVQLGKGRAGWYLPSVLERALPPRRRGARRIIPAYQQLAVGDEVPDWGAGLPVFRVVHVAPPDSLVYLSLRDRSDRWRWPRDGAASRDEVLALSWALVVTPTAEGGTRLHIRLRIDKLGRRFPQVVAMVGGLMDLATIALLQRGLAERLARAH